MNSQYLIIPVFATIVLFIKNFFDDRQKYLTIISSIVRVTGETGRPSFYPQLLGEKINGDPSGFSFDLQLSILYYQAGY